MCGERYPLAIFLITKPARGDRPRRMNCWPPMVVHGRIRKMYHILIKKDLEELSSAAADLFSQIANDSISRKGFFSVALSGGSTPRSLYSLLASDRFRDTIDWSKVRIFFGDERNVPHDSPD